MPLDSGDPEAGKLLSRPRSNGRKAQGTALPTDEDSGDFTASYLPPQSGSGRQAEMTTPNGGSNGPL